MALPDYSRDTGFYDPTHTYTGYLQPRQPIINISQPGGFNDYLYRNATTDFQPSGAKSEYLQRLTKMGLGGTNTRARAAQSMYGAVTEGYGQAQLRSNYELFFPEFLDQTDLNKVFANQSYEQQGLDARRFGQSKYRWGQRPG